MLGKVSDHILRIPDCVPHELCDEIIEHYRHSDLWEPGRTGAEGTIDAEVRDCGQLTLKGDLDDKFFHCAHKALEAYAEQHEHLHVSQDDGYTLLRYNERQKYDVHVDVGPKTHYRVLSASFWLNDDYDGGKMHFPTLERFYSCAKGDALLFPSNFLFPHAVTPVSWGTRYSIVTWYS